MTTIPTAYDPALDPGRRAEPAAPSVRRVRHQTRDTIAVMAFSALTSCLLSGVFVLLLGIGK